MTNLSNNRTELQTAPADIQSDLIRLVYASVPKSIFTIFVNSSILGFLLMDVIAPLNILLWYGTTNLFSIWRYFQYRRFRQLDETDPVSISWENSILVNSMVSGALWGAAGIWLFPQLALAHQVFLAFVVAGMCAGAVTTLSPFLKAAIIFVALGMTPLIIQFLLLDSNISYAMSFMSLLFSFMLFSAARDLHRTITGSLVIRHQRNRAVETIRYQALYDELTNLPNRRFLLDHLEQDLARSIRHRYFGAVLFIDLDHFKSVNDSLGHGVGDVLLRQASERISKRLRVEDTIGRLGGDEFVVLISEAGYEMTEASDRAQEIAEDLLGLFAAPFEIQGHDIHLTASIGISMYPWKQLSSDDFLQRADVAMYQAKEVGRNSVRQFIPEMQRAVEKRRVVEKGLRRALENDELELYYQPILNDRREIVCSEALIRWNHPEQGVIAPAEFIDIAEKTELIILLGDWVLKTACSQLAEITARRDITVSVNVSPRQFGEADFHHRLQALMLNCRTNPGRIRLEITEGMMLKDIEQTIEKIQFLKALGLGFSVDDFGTGYSSLSYLKQLPIDILKIDKSFVMNIDRDADDAIIVETIIAMAQHLKIGVVAEGVETEAALDFLTAKGCKNFQGYLFSKPVPYRQFLAMLEQQA